ncbi:MotE family protein [Roseicyclus sp.]|uniref:MotE family protein n=1 Tax=Roseicyclus sp. TaxID=1914329 RepID=UPI003F6C93BC
MVEKDPLRRRRRQRWLLTGLGLIFAISAVMRLGTIDLAFAQEGAGPASENMPPAMMTQTLAEALREIEALRQDLDRRAVALADREQAVLSAQALVEERLAELEAAETRLEAWIALSDSAVETDLDRLTAVYETMSPAEAAAIFGQMDASFAAGFLTRMAPAASASLMAELTPEQAYAVSVVIATRNAAAPRMQDR